MLVMLVLQPLQAIGGQPSDLSLKSSNLCTNECYFITHTYVLVEDLNAVSTVQISQGGRCAIYLFSESFVHAE
jgi:hypothetical protein